MVLEALVTVAGHTLLGLIGLLILSIAMLFTGIILTVAGGLLMVVPLFLIKETLNFFKWVYKRVKN